MCKCIDCTGVYDCKGGKELCLHGHWVQGKDDFIAKPEDLRKYKEKERFCSDFEAKAEY